jgi:hypothetical protein
LVQDCSSVSFLPSQTNPPPPQQASMSGGGMGLGKNHYENISSNEYEVWT